MPSQSIDKQIAVRLSKIGFKSVGSSSTRKIVQSFEQNEYAKRVFGTISEGSFLRTLLHLIAQEKLPITKDQIQQMLQENRERLKKVLQTSLDRNLLCRNCSEIIQRYSIYEDKPGWKMKCPKCSTPNDLGQCKEENDWSFPRISVTACLDKLVKARILTSKVLGNCTRCMISETFEQIPLRNISLLPAKKLQGYLKKMYCKQCGKLYDFTELFDLSELAAPLWNRNGTWLEWYTKNIIKGHFSNCSVEQGLVVKNGEAIEVDVMLLRNGKITSLECKALSIRKSASFSDVSDVLKLLDFSDQVVLVITTSLKDNDRKILLRRGDGKLKVIEGSEIETLGNFL